MQKRWYDMDPSVSLAVSLLENADEKLQLECADYIIEKAKSFGVRISENDLAEAFNSIFRRWYDKNKQMHYAFEYFKMASYDVQLGLALDIIEKLDTHDSVEQSENEQNEKAE